MLGVNKYCNNNACRAETGKFPMRIEAQCRNFKFWLTLTKNENKLSQIAYNDIKLDENKAFWSKKIKSLLEQIGLGELWVKAHVKRNFVSSSDQVMFHLLYKHQCYFHMWRYQVLARKLTWYFIGVYIINIIIHSKYFPILIG